MTDRISSFVVVLDHDVREDDAQSTLNALRMIRGVVSVEPVVSDIQQTIAHARVDMEWRGRLIDFLQKPTG